MSSNEIRRWADEHQYDQESFTDDMWTEETGVLPRVHLLWMTPDPLGAVAAACRMYEGKATTDLSQITDEERESYWQDSQATHLKAPLEYVQFHFFIEGVDRAFTHQIVRQRTAVFAQESMRFAVVDELDRRTTLPPSLYGTRQSAEDSLLPNGESERNRAVWDDAIRHIQRAYDFLVNNGMPAEEARGLLPHATATRLNYDTNLRNLVDHAGNRLCTQAQFPWRLVFNQMAHAIRNYGRGTAEEWQFDRLADLFKPVCYQLGKCPFKASFDRSCSIRDRVEDFAHLGVPPEQWDRGYGHDDPTEHPYVPPIDDSEWMLDPAAARKRGY